MNIHIIDCRKILAEQNIGDIELFVRTLCEIKFEGTDPIVLTRLSGALHGLYNRLAEQNLRKVAQLTGTFVEDIIKYVYTITDRFDPTELNISQSQTKFLQSAFQITDNMFSTWLSVLHDAIENKNNLYQYDLRCSYLSSSEKQRYYHCLFHDKNNRYDTAIIDFVPSEIYNETVIDIKGIDINCEDIVDLHYRNGKLYDISNSKQIDIDELCGKKTIITIYRRECKMEDRANIANNIMSDAKFDAILFQ